LGIFALEVFLPLGCRLVVSRALRVIGAFLARVFFEAVFLGADFFEATAFFADFFEVFRNCAVLVGSDFRPADVFFFDAFFLVAMGEV